MDMLHQVPFLESLQLYHKLLKNVMPKH